MHDSFRIAVRQFGPFEAAFRERWESFCAATGCTQQLVIGAFDVQRLHEILLGEGGLRRGDWDVALVVTDWLEEARLARALADLGPRLRSDPAWGYPSAWADSLLRQQRFGDAVLGAPFHDGPQCLIYRADLLGEAGLPPPDTWEAFQNAARRLAAPEFGRWGAILAGFPDGHNTVYDFCAQLWSRGGELFDDRGRLSVRSAAGAAALDYYRALVRDPLAMHPDCLKFDSVRAGLAFARGEAAMMINWFGFAVLTETEDKSQVRGRVAVAPLPSAPGFPSANLNVYWVLGASAAGPRLEQAIDFIRHCTGPEGDKRLTLGGGVGCRRSTWGDEEVRRRFPFYPQLETLHAGARELPRLPEWETVAAAINRMMDRLARSHTPIPDLLEEATRASCPPDAA